MVLGIKTGCACGNKCYFRHVEADEKPSKKSKKGGAKGSVALLKESIQLRCVRLMSVMLALQNSRKDHMRKLLHHERCAREAAWNLAKHIYKLKNAD